MWYVISVQLNHSMKAITSKTVFLIIQSFHSFFLNYTYSTTLFCISLQTVLHIFDTCATISCCNWIKHHHHLLFIYDSFILTAWIQLFSIRLLRSHCIFLKLIIYVIYEFLRGWFLGFKVTILKFYDPSLTRMQNRHLTQHRPAPTTEAVIQKPPRVLVI